MSSQPSVSVVIPTYQRNELLRAALESLAAQTYEGELEAIVVESDETPRAESVVAEFEFASYHRQTDFFPRVDSGTHNSALARDVGIHHSSGTYIQFLDDDDELAPEALERKVHAVENNSTAKAAYNAILCNDGTIERSQDNVQGRELAYTLRTLQSAAPLSTLFVEQTVMRKVGPMRLATHCDIGTIIEVCLRTPLVYIDKPLTIRNDSVTLASSSETQSARVQTAKRYEGLTHLIHNND